LNTVKSQWRSYGTLRLCTRNNLAPLPTKLEFEVKNGKKRAKEAKAKLLL